MSHNGGKSQLNFATLQTGGDYPFLNHLKTAQIWALVDDSAPPAPSTLNSNGYPTSISNGGVYTVFFIPTQTNRPGNWVIKWTGGGTVYCPIGKTIVSGSLSGTDGRCVITPTDAAVASGQLRIVLGISAITTGITSLVFVHADDEASYDAGNVFGVKFKQRLVEGGFGVYRFVDWQITNTSFVTTWATRKPTTYVFYAGDEFRSSLFGGTTTNVGDAYSLAFGGFVLADKATVILKFNADAATTTTTLNVNGTGVIAMAGPYGDAFFSTQKPKSGIYAVLVYDAELNKWIKYGGDLDGGHQFLKNAVPPELMVQLCNEMGTHPWFCVPHLALDPKTDYATSLATYCLANLASGLIPRFEPSNEVWNFSGGFFQTGYGWNKAFAHWATSTDTHNWYGKVLSTMGQDISAVYSADRTKYQLICGVQTGTGATASSSNDRLNSSKYVTVDGGSAAKNWVTHIACANYWAPSTYGAAAETTHANNYAAAGTPSAKLAIATQYATENQDIAATGTRPNLYDLNLLYGQWKTWGAGLGVLGMTGYEGGFSPDYTSNATLDALRAAAKAVAGLNALTTSNYNNFINAGAALPSCYQFASYNNAWSVFDPDIYATPSPQWDAIVLFNQQSGAAGSPVVPRAGMKIWTHAR